MNHPALRWEMNVMKINKETPTPLSSVLVGGRYGGNSTKSNTNESCDSVDPVARPASPPFLHVVHGNLYITNEIVEHRGNLLLSTLVRIQALQKRGQNERRVKHQRSTSPVTPSVPNKNLETDSPPTKETKKGNPHEHPHTHTPNPFDPTPNFQDVTAFYHPQLRPQPQSQT